MGSPFFILFSNYMKYRERILDRDPAVPSDSSNMMRSKNSKYKTEAILISEVCILPYRQCGVTLKNL